MSTVRSLGCTLPAALLVLITAFPAQPALAQVMQLPAQSLAVSPDGHYLAYGTESGSESSLKEFWVADLEKGTSARIATFDTARFAPQLSYMRPVWSPDSSHLAYFQLSESGLTLHIWSVAQSREIYTSDRPNSGEDMSRLWPPQWTADSRSVLFAAAVRRVGIADAATQFTPGWRDQELFRELRGLTPSKHGVTVLKSALPHVDDDHSGEARSGRMAMSQTEVVAVDVQSRTERTIASGATFVGIRVARKGSSAVAIAADPLEIADRSGHYSIYLLPLNFADSSPTQRGERDSAQGPIDGRGKPLRRLAARIPQGYGMSISLAPSGRYAAWTTSGPDASGDLYTVALETGRQRNLTGSLGIAENPLNHLTSTGLRALDWRGKFGAFFIAPIWSDDENELFIPRPRARENGSVSISLDLWRVSRDGRRAAAMAFDEPVSIVEIAQCGEVAAPCVGNGGHELLLRVRLERALPESDVLAFAALDLRTGRTRTLREIGTAGSPPIAYEAEINAQAPRLTVAPLAGDAIGIEESNERPQELWTLSVRSGKPSRSLALLNPGRVPPVGRYVRLGFNSADGERLEAALRLPPGVRNGERPPVVISVYSGGNYSRSGDGEFDGGSDDWRTLRHRGHFATLAVDLQSSQPPGTYCDKAAINVGRALDEAISTGLIDGERLGIIGISFGGYTVNCVVTHSERFRAAVSVAGISNLSLSVKAAALGGFTNYLGWSGGPWQHPDVFVKDSPIFHLDRVTTPLLLVYGKQDSLLEHSITMFEGLYALGKPAELVAYDAAGHGEMLSDPDFWSRVIEWFNTWFRINERPQ